MEFDRAGTERLVALYVTPDVAATRAELLEQLAPQPGERLLDAGSGPGFLAQAIGEAVGRSGRVCGVDVSEPLLAYARERAAGTPWVEYRHGDVARLAFGEAEFDAAVCIQVLEYVPEVDAALSELFRVLRPGGRLLVMDTDWDSVLWRSSDRSRMERVIAAWNEHAAHPHLSAELAGRLRKAGFRIDGRRAIVLFNPDFDPETYSNRVIDMIAAFVVGRGLIARDEARAWAEDLRESGARGDYFFSLNRYVFAARRP